MTSTPPLHPPAADVTGAARIPLQAATSALPAGPQTADKSRDPDVTIPHTACHVMTDKCMNAKNRSVRLPGGFVPRDVSTPDGPCCLPTHLTRPYGPLVFAEGAWPHGREPKALTTEATPTARLRRGGTGVSGAAEVAVGVACLTGPAVIHSRHNPLQNNNDDSSPTGVAAGEQRLVVVVWSKNPGRGSSSELHRSFDLQQRSYEHEGTCPCKSRNTRHADNGANLERASRAETLVFSYRPAVRHACVSICAAAGTLGFFVCAERGSDRDLKAEEAPAPARNDASTHSKSTVPRTANPHLGRISDRLPAAGSPPEGFCMPTGPCHEWSPR